MSATPEQIAREAAEKIVRETRIEYYTPNATTTRNPEIRSITMPDISYIILEAIRRAVRDTGTLEALKLAAKGDTSQTCSPGNEGIVVSAMDALAKLKAIAVEDKP